MTEIEVLTKQKELSQKMLDVINEKCIDLEDKAEILSQYNEILDSFNRASYYLMLPS